MHYEVTVNLNNSLYDRHIRNIHSSSDHNQNMTRFIYLEKLTYKCTYGQFDHKQNCCQLRIQLLPLRKY